MKVKHQVAGAIISTIQGRFDGQNLVGADGRSYPVPPNYASKSMLVEKDVLNLYIYDTGQTVIKQIDLVPRINFLGEIERDQSGNFTVTNRNTGKRYNFLLATATYLKVKAGDQVAAIINDEPECTWAVVKQIIGSAPEPSEEELNVK